MGEGFVKSVLIIVQNLCDTLSINTGREDKA